MSKPEGSFFSELGLFLLLLMFGMGVVTVNICWSLRRIFNHDYQD
jgi:hypothetical protein